MISQIQIWDFSNISFIPKILRSEVVRQLVRQLVYQVLLYYISSFVLLVAPRISSKTSPSSNILWPELYVTNFSLNWQFWFFGANLPKRNNSGQKWKSEQNYLILDIRISLGTKFKFKLTILIFWIKFSQKGYFRFKTRKVNTIIEFCIFQLD